MIDILYFLAGVCATVLYFRNQRKHQDEEFGKRLRCVALANLIILMSSSGFSNFPNTGTNMLLMLFAGMLPILFSYVCRQAVE